MAKYLAWFGTTVIALAGIVAGVLPIEFGPRWAWLTAGIVLGLLAAATFPRVFGSNASPGAPPTSTTVEHSPTMTAGNNATQIVNEGGGTFNIEQKKGK